MKTTGMNQRGSEPLQGANRLTAGRLLLAAMILASSSAGISALSAGTALGDTGQSEVTAAEPPQPTQTQCPVMVGNRIDPNIYTDYRGERVYFCCQVCKAAFDKDPEQYLSRLPQFASVQVSAVLELEEHEHGDNTGRFSLIMLAEPTGALTLSLVALTVGLVWLRRVRRLKPRTLLKLHKIVGVCALCSGAIHAMIVMLAD